MDSSPKHPSSSFSTVTIHFNSQKQRFAVPASTPTFQTMVLDYFAIQHAQSSAYLTTREDDDSVVLPMDVGFMRDSMEYDLKVRTTVPPATIFPPLVGVPQPTLQSTAEADQLRENSSIANPVQSQQSSPTPQPNGAPAAASETSTSAPPRTPAISSPPVTHAKGAQNFVSDEEKSSRGDEQVVVMYDYAPTSQNEIAIAVGDIIKVSQRYNNLWWTGVAPNGSEGFFPTNYVKLEGHSQLLSVELGVDPQAQDVDLQDDEYFDGYANLQIHWEMLRDKSRTLAYQKGIQELAPFLKDKIVLDIGAGSGILSIFCAKAGAKHVYGVDASGVLEHARAVVKANGLADKITLLKGKIEEIELPVDKVDFIISEWMGTMLICESMIASVLTARQKYLKPEGRMCPATSRLFLCPLDCSKFYEEKVHFWDDVYGVDMKCLKKSAHEEFFGRPVFSRTVPADELIATPELIYSLDMGSATEDDLENILSSFSFTIDRNGTLHGFGTWFDVTFGDEGSCVLGTSPDEMETHWKQVMFLFEDAPTVEKGDTITGVITIERNKYWRRHFEVVLKFNIGGQKKFWQKRFPVWR